jgi:hypothetical protein
MSMRQTGRFPARPMPPPRLKVETPPLAHEVKATAPPPTPDPGPREEAVPITLRALRQRVERRLRQTGRRLVVRRSGCYVIEGQRVVESGVDPVALGRTLGVIQPWEQMAQERDGGGR